MRTREDIKQYEQRLEEAYLSTPEIMTDNELHNVNVKIANALKSFSNGMTPEEIKDSIEGITSVPISKFEKAQDRIQRELIKRGMIKGSESFIKKEDELLLKWAKGGQLR